MGNNVVTLITFSRARHQALLAYCRVRFWSQPSYEYGFPLSAWEQAVAQHGFVHDPAQWRAVQARSVVMSN